MAHVKVFANLRTITGQKEVNIPGRNIQAVLDRLIRDFPEMTPFLFENAQLRRRVILTLNGQALDLGSCMEIAITEQDQIAIFPPIAGG